MTGHDPAPAASPSSNGHSLESHRWTVPLAGPEAGNQAWTPGRGTAPKGPSSGLCQGSGLQSGSQRGWPRALEVATHTQQPLAAQGAGSRPAPRPPTSPAQTHGGLETAPQGR